MLATGNVRLFDCHFIVMYTVSCRLQVDLMLTLFFSDKFVVTVNIIPAAVTEHLFNIFCCECLTSNSKDRLFHFLSLSIESYTGMGITVTPR